MWRSPSICSEEHDELLRMRDALQAGLAEATMELDRYRRRLFRRGKRSS